jgi:hypothetical protein
VTDGGRECEQPLMEIDNRGTRLRGCMTCNIWLSADDKKVGLSEEDLAALHALKGRRPKPTPGAAALDCATTQLNRGGWVSGCTRRLGSIARPHAWVPALVMATTKTLITGTVR